MAFKVNNKKNDDGTYTLSYGKGKSKLIASMWKDGGYWRYDCNNGIDEASGFKTMRDCKAGWGEWAKDAYGDDGSKTETAETPPVPSGPTPPTTPGPPPPTFGPPKTGPKPVATREPLGFTHNADPFDPRFKNEQKELTPLGVLVEIGAWIDRHKVAVQRAQQNVPHDPFTVLLDQVKYTLARECPDIIQGDDDDTEPAASPQQCSAASSTPSPAPAGGGSPAGPPPPPTFLGNGPDGAVLRDEDLPF